MTMQTSATNRHSGDAVRFMSCGMTIVAWMCSVCTTVTAQAPPLPPQINPGQIQALQIQPNRPPKLFESTPSQQNSPSPKLKLPDQTPASEEEQQQLQSHLASADFQLRAAASKRLTTLPPKDLAAVVNSLLTAPSAEALMRVHAELETRYQSESRNERVNASALLEKMAEANRLLSADPAMHVLQKYWRTRIEVAFDELEEMGAIVKDGVFSKPRSMIRDRDGRPARQVLLTETYRGGAAGLEVFRRLAVLTGPHIGMGGMNVYLLHGHPLNEDEVRMLTDIVGENRVQIRSTVALGITQHIASQALSAGVLVGSVSKGGAAEKAGLQEGDLILSLHDANDDIQPQKFDVDQWLLRGGPKDPEGGPEKGSGRLRDFEDLVERLKAYRPNDKVKLQVVRRFTYDGGGFQPFGLPPRRAIPEREEQFGKVDVVEVKLIGWAQLPMIK